MADSASVALQELVGKASLDGNLNFLRGGVHVLAEAVMEAEVSRHLGADPDERTSERKGERNMTFRVSQKLLAQTHAASLDTDADRANPVRRDIPEERGQPFRRSGRTNPICPNRPASPPFGTSSMVSKWILPSRT